MLTQQSLSDGKNAKNIGRGAYIKAASIESTYIKDICASRYTGPGKAFFVGGAGAVEDSRIHLQFILILQVELIGMG